MKHFILTLFLAFNATLFCQTNFSISGTVFETDKTPIENGDIILISKKDGKIINYTFIENGRFYLDKIQTGSYTLKINAIGYEIVSKEINIQKNINLNFTLASKSNQLEEVEIVAKKNLIQNKRGNLIVNVANTIFSSEPTATNLLAKLPKLQINEAQETIEIIGKGTPLIYVDNQQVSFQMLNTLPVEEIKTIEIINNPSAKYESNATSVLLITLKKNTSNNLKIVLKETISFKRFFNNYLSNYLTIKKDKNEIKLSISYNHLNVWEQNSTSYSIPNQNIQSTHLITASTHRNQAVFNGGFHHQINENDYFSVNSNSQVQNEPFSFNTLTSYSENNNLSNINTQTNDLGSRYFTNTNLNFQKQFNNTDRLFLGAQHVFYLKKITNNITNIIDDNTFDIQRNQDFSINSYNAKINYEKKFSENITLESGVSFLKTITSNNNDGSIYNFTENNSAFYSQLSAKAFGNLTYSLGFRIEENTASGYFLERKEDQIDRKNTFLFPKLNIHFPFNNKQSLTFNYNKSIVRPTFSSLSNTAAYVNPYIEFTGNLGLKNAITDEVSLHYNFNKKAINFSYSHTKNPIKLFTFSHNSINNTTAILPLNFSNRTNISLETNIPVEYKRWSSENNFSFIYSKFTDDNLNTNKIQPYLYYYSNQKFSIKKNTSFNLNFWGTTLQGEGPFSTLPIFTMNATFQKKFKNLDITVSYNDIFNSLEFNEHHRLPNINGNTLFFTDVNALSISLKYNFGNIGKSGFTNKTINNTRRIR